MFAVGQARMRHQALGSENVDAVLVPRVFATCSSRTMLSKTQSMQTGGMKTSMQTATSGGTYRRVWSGPEQQHL